MLDLPSSICLVTDFTGDKETKSDFHHALSHSLHINRFAKSDRKKKNKSKLSRDASRMSLAPETVGKKCVDESDIGLVGIPQRSCYNWCAECCVRLDCALGHRLKDEE